jgi:fumarylacetoacetase
MKLDRTHEPNRTSWVTSASGHADFPIQNLPLGVFAPAGGVRRVGIAIGDEILDVGALAATGLLEGDGQRAAQLCRGETLNELMAADPAPRRALRLAVSDLFAADSPQAELVQHARSKFLHASSACTMHLPARVGGFTDFFAGLHHAVTAGRMLRPNNPLSPNYKYLPIAYNSRASTIGVSPARLRRPSGQLVPPGANEPIKAPTQKLDYEFELGVWIGRGNPDGEPIDIAHAAASIFGYCILNDWSSRDIQRWEAQPLGPFLAKSSATTISPWIITPEALAPFRARQSLREAGDPQPLPYLFDAADQESGALGVDLEIRLATAKMRATGANAERISATRATNLYWTPAQLVAHHTVNGCVLNPGDLFGTGTISGTEDASAGCLLEQTIDGTNPLQLANGEQRGFLEDGDEVTLYAKCVREGYVPIGFGQCRGEVLSAATKLVK